TVGVLSFEEKNISEEHKKEIMESFENTLLAGLDKEQYNITWIEHTDKNNLELNFIIPKVELNSGKSMNPYFDGVDRELVDAWKDTINQEYQLTDPNDPLKQQSHVIAKDLPKDPKRLSNAIGESLILELEQGNIKDRKDVIQHLEALDLEIARVTDNAISIKNPYGKQNIRLKGEFYEKDFRYSREYRAEKSRAREDYQREQPTRTRETRARLSELTEKKLQFNRKKYSPTQDKRREAGNEYQREHTKHRKEHTERNQSSNYTDAKQHQSGRNQPQAPSRNSSREYERGHRESNSTHQQQKQTILETAHIPDQQNHVNYSDISRNDSSTNNHVDLQPNTIISNRQHESRENRVNDRSRADETPHQQHKEKTNEITANEKRIFQSVRELTERVKQLRNSTERSIFNITARATSPSTSESELNRTKSDIEKRNEIERAEDHRISELLRQTIQQFEHSINAERPTDNRLKEPLRNTDTEINRTDQFIRKSDQIIDKWQRNEGEIKQYIERASNYISATKVTQVEKGKDRGGR
ncbi:relaxase/mobilization nuclease domain-containing protein, partial [Acinetobacter sp. B5B]|uniref:relaxase/mobilization nuclease domain-containing protein n=1 Tax=Acinetobacter baretiae TaxID=2605383 RepID=UPI0018C2AFB5